MNIYDQSKCDKCGRFLRVDGPGVCWTQTWGYTMDATPDLHDPVYRCSPCTDRYGALTTNCHEGNGTMYHGRNPIHDDSNVRKTELTGG